MHDLRVQPAQEEQIDTMPTYQRAGKEVEQMAIAKSNRNRR